MKKAVCILLVMLVVLLCAYILFSNQLDSQGEGEYYSVKTLFTYDDLVAATDILRENGKLQPTYTVNIDSDDFSVVYHFNSPNNRTTYPIDFETYFNTKANGTFYTCIIFNEACSLHHFGEAQHALSHLKVYNGDEDYDKIRELMAREGVWIRTETAVEIEDPELISYTYYRSFTDTDTGAFHYTVRYGDTKIMELISCTELDDAFLSLIFENLIII